ncbi:NAD(P)/FAD-dependent oxidoreductase [Primorskyibacter sp. S87]|uniref:NAD(P)/FAD-dependent oxidoreductase n=1 Tax=Primorskyibacter sp. S87 TaxID=3415126 RepID=UPI003C7DB5EC
MPGPVLAPFQSDLNLPKTVDVVVIGGGIVGVSAALELAERGLSVLLCEKGQIGGEQSSRNWGWVRISRRDPREIPLMLEATRIWEGLDARTGHATGYRRTGNVFTVGSDRDFARYEQWARHLHPHEVECRMVSGAALDQLLPGHQMKLKGALYTPMDGCVEPHRAVSAIALGARAAGARIMTSCAVRTLDVEGGRLAGVVTERGRVACRAVVLAGGAWSRLFAGNAGIALPQLKVLNTVMRSSPVAGGPELSVKSGGFAMRKRADGGYTIAGANDNTVDLVPDSLRIGYRFLNSYRQEWRSLRFRLSRRWREEAAQARRWRPDEITPFENCRILDPAPSERSLRLAWDAARKGFPVLEKAEIVQSWAGLIDVTPDAIPVISPVDALQGMFVATGFSGHGFGIGPGAGRLVADLITGAAPVVDPHPFRLSRFTDGSRVAPDPGC